MANCNIEVPTPLEDECKGCLTKGQCVELDNDLTYLNITGETDLKTFIDALITKIEYLESQIEILQLNNG